MPTPLATPPGRGTRSPPRHAPWPTHLGDGASTWGLTANLRVGSESRATPLGPATGVPTSIGRRASSMACTSASISFRTSSLIAESFSEPTRRKGRKVSDSTHGKRPTRPPTLEVDIHLLERRQACTSPPRISKTTLAPQEEIRKLTPKFLAIRLATPLATPPRPATRTWRRARADPGLVVLRLRLLTLAAPRLLLGQRRLLVPRKTLVVCGQVDNDSVYGRHLPTNQLRGKESTHRIQRIDPSTCTSRRTSAASQPPPW